jgi:hypothetical protein
MRAFQLQPLELHNSREGREREREGEREREREREGEGGRERESKVGGRNRCQWKVAEAAEKDELARKGREKAEGLFLGLDPSLLRRGKEKKALAVSPLSAAAGSSRREQRRRRRRCSRLV